MPFHLSVVTPEGEAFDKPVDRVVLPGTEGEFGVLPGHEPFMTGLQMGAMEIRQGELTLYAAVGRGFAEIHEDKVSVLVGTCEFAHEIDRSRAEVARDRALAQLQQVRASAEGEAEFQKLHDDYLRSLARLATSEKFKG